MDAEEFKKAIHPLLKRSRFKRSSNTWRRDQGETIAVLNVQKSQWGDGVLYVNIGSGEIWLLTLYAKNVAECISGRTLKKIKEEIDG